MALRSCMAAAVALISIHTTAISLKSIPKLEKYEAKAQKAAEWSRTAEKRLRDTRYTVGAGLVTATVSSLSALYNVYGFLAAHHHRLPFLLGWSILVASSAFYVRRYMRSFWDSKAKIPLLDEYNEAISDTHTVTDLMLWICIGWAAVALVNLGTMFSSDQALVA